MEKLEDYSVKIKDVCYITITQAAIYCEMTKINFWLQKDKFDTVLFSNILFVNMDQVIEFNNHRLYRKSLKNKKNRL